MSELNGNGNGNGTKMTWSTIVTLVAIIGWMASFLLPMEKKLDEVSKWQEDYMLGHIPSSAEPEIAFIKEHFAEIETQFRAFKQEMLANEVLMKEDSNRNWSHIEKNSDAINSIRERIGILEDRSRRAVRHS